MNIITRLKEEKTWPTATDNLEDMTEEQLQAIIEAEDIEDKITGRYETYYQDDYGNWQPTI